MKKNAYSNGILSCRANVDCEIYDKLTQNTVFFHVELMTRLDQVTNSVCVWCACTSVLTLPSILYPAMWIYSIEKREVPTKILNSMYYTRKIQEVEAHFLVDQKSKALPHFLQYVNAPCCAYSLNRMLSVRLLETWKPDSVLEEKPFWCQVFWMCKFKYHGLGGFWWTCILDLWKHSEQNGAMVIPLYCSIWC